MIILNQDYEVIKFNWVSPENASPNPYDQIILKPNFVKSDLTNPGTINFKCHQLNLYTPNYMY